MVGGEIIHIVGDTVEVLGDHTFDRMWRGLEPGACLLQVRVGDRLWWQSHKGYLTRDGEFADKPIGRCVPVSAPGDGILPKIGGGDGE